MFLRFWKRVRRNRISLPASTEKTIELLDSDPSNAAQMREDILAAALELAESPEFVRVTIVKHGDQIDVEASKEHPQKSTAQKRLSPRHGIAAAVIVFLGGLLAFLASEPVEAAFNWAKSKYQNSSQSEATKKPD